MWLQVPTVLGGDCLIDWHNAGFEPDWAANNQQTLARKKGFGQLTMLPCRVVPRRRCVSDGDGVWTTFMFNYLGCEYVDYNVVWIGEGERSLDVSNMTVLADALADCGIELCLGWEGPVPFSAIVEALVPARLGLLQKVADQTGLGDLVRRWWADKNE